MLISLFTPTQNTQFLDQLLSQTPSTDDRGAFQDPTHVSFWNSNSFWYYTRADQNRLIDSPVRFQANRLKNFFPSGWHREHQIVYLKADLLKVAGCVPGGVAILYRTSR